MKNSTFYLIMLAMFVVTIISGLIWPGWEPYAFAGVLAFVSLLHAVITWWKKKKKS